MLHSSERIIKHKLGLLNLAEELGNVSRACKVIGLSRDTFYRYRNAVEKIQDTHILTFSVFCTTALITLRDINANDKET